MAWYGVGVVLHGAVLALVLVLVLYMVWGEVLRGALCCVSALGCCAFVNRKKKKKKHQYLFLPALLRVVFWFEIRDSYWCVSSVSSALPSQGQGTNFSTGIF